MNPLFQYQKIITQTDYLRTMANLGYKLNLAQKFLRPFFLSLTKKTNKNIFFKRVGLALNSICNCFGRSQNRSSKSNLLTSKIHRRSVSLPKTNKAWNIYHLWSFFKKNLRFFLIFFNNWSIILHLINY